MLRLVPCIGRRSSLRQRKNTKRCCGRWYRSTVSVTAEGAMRNLHRLLRRVKARSSHEMKPAAVPLPRRSSAPLQTRRSTRAETSSAVVAGESPFPRNSSRPARPVDIPSVENNRLYLRCVAPGRALFAWIRIQPEDRSPFFYRARAALGFGRGIPDEMLARPSRRAIV